MRRSSVIERPVTDGSSVAEALLGSVGVDPECASEGAVLVSGVVVAGSTTGIGSTEVTGGLGDGDDVGFGFGDDVGFGDGCDDGCDVLVLESLKICVT